MALVCLGSCVFTIDSVWAFIDGPMAWDSSRVAAAIPSGVGFLGAASIWKGARETATRATPRVLNAPFSRLTERHVERAEKVAVE